MFLALPLLCAPGCRERPVEPLSGWLGPLVARALPAPGKTSGPAEGAAPNGDHLQHGEAPRGYVLMRAKAQLDADHGNALLLVDEPAEERVVPIFVGTTEALAIRLRLAGESYQRPLTHDLFDATMRQLGARLLSVRIDALRGGIFHGTIVVRDRDGARHEVDARPSDAVALAVGNGVPIHMAKEVLERAGYRIDDLAELENRASRGTSDATPL